MLAATALRTPTALPEPGGRLHRSSTRHGDRRALLAPSGLVELPTPTAAGAIKALMEAAALGESDGSPRSPTA